MLVRRIGDLEGCLDGRVYGRLHDIIYLYDQLPVCVAGIDL